MPPLLNRRPVYDVRRARMFPLHSTRASHAVRLCSGVDLEVVDKTPLVDWFANHYKDFGAKLEFVTNKSQEGAQFVRGAWLSHAALRIS